MIQQRVDRVRLSDVPLVETVAHGGAGTIRFARIAGRDATDGALNFIDLAVLPPGSSIGPHRHAGDEEEFYLVLDGTGTMRRDGETFDVVAGDLVRNAPGGRHSLENTGSGDLRIFVFEAEVRA